VAKLKINAALRKLILEFAIIPVKQCRDQQWQQHQKKLGLSPLSLKSYKASIAS